MNWNYARYGLEGLEKFGEYVSLIYEEEGLERRWTNTQIQRQSDALANGLKDLGVTPGEVVAVVLPNGPAVPVVFSAIFKAGAVFLPIVFALTAHEIRYILEDSKAATLITDAELYPKVVEASRGLDRVRNFIVKSDKALPPSTISLEHILSTKSQKFPLAMAAADDLAVLMYTSGTTGSPKGVMLSHRNISSNVEAGVKHLPTDPSDTMLIPLPLNHIYGLLMVNECHLTGARIVLHKWFNPTLTLNSITKHRVTQFVGVPTMYISLLEHFDPAVHRTDSIRRWMCAAAPLSRETLHLVEKKLGGRLLQGYGLTEASPTVSRQTESRPIKPGSVGTAVEGVEIRIVDEKDKPLLPGQEGEICVRGPNVMMGYLNKGEETREALKGGWLHTGDLGYLDEDGDLFITGRKKDLIIRGGENISPGALEDVLYKHPAVQETAVVGVADPVYGEEVKAFVVLKPKVQVKEQELIEHCLKYTARYKAPKSVTFLDALPKNSVGKILKRELRGYGHSS